MNGRSDGDPLGNFTYNNINLGASTIDYSLCSQNFYDKVNNFMVLPQNELSDHNKIVTELKGFPEPENNFQDTHNWEKLKPSYIWDDCQNSKFTTNLGNSEETIREIKQRIEAGLINSTGDKIQKLFTDTATKTLKQKRIKPRPPTKNQKNNTSKNYQKWFDKDCHNLKQEVRNLGRDKGKDPQNSFLREKFHEKLKEYKRTCGFKKYNFWQNNFNILENSCKDS